MTNFAPTRTTYDTGDRRWARDFLALRTYDITLNGDLFTPGTTIKSGTHIGRVTATKLGAPYTPGASNGTEKSVGLLVNDFVVKPGRHLVAIANGGGPVDRRYLPAGNTPTAEGHIPAVSFIN